MLSTARPGVEHQAHLTQAQSYAQQLANAYLAATLGTNFHAARGFCGNQRWYFLIEYHDPAGEKAIGVGAKLAVDPFSRVVLPLTAEQIEAILAAPALQSAQMRGEFARGVDGYLLCAQAQHNATAYLRAHLSLHYRAQEGLFVPSPNALWQFSIYCQMSHTGAVGPLGLVDVDAHSGDVTLLTPSQLQQIRNRADAVIQHRTLAPAA